MSYECPRCEMDVYEICYNCAKDARIADLVAEIDRLRALVELAWDQGWVAGRCTDPFAENPYRRNQ